MAGKKKAQPPKASSSKGTTASRGKALELSVVNEEQIRNILKDLGGHASTSSAAASTGKSEKQLLKQYSQVYDKLQEHGFSQGQIQQVLQELPQGSATVEVALDWLCLHLPQEELPRRFAAGLRAGKAGSEVKVVKRAGAVQQQAQQQRSSRQAAADDWGLPPSESSEEEESDDDARLAPVDGSSKQAGGTAEDKEAAKAWILQQYAGGDDDYASDGDATSSSSSFDDWELWADPREVERRRQERARAKIPPEVRRVQVAEELTKVKDMAARAKSAGDKAQQKAAGQMIRDLKNEMDQLGMTDADVALIMAQQQQQQQAECAGADFAGLSLFDDEPAAGSSKQQEQQEEQEQQEARSLAAEASAQSAGASAAGASAAAGSDEEQAWDFDSGLEQSTSAHASPEPQPSAADSTAAVGEHSPAAAGAAAGSTAAGKAGEEEDTWALDIFEQEVEYVPPSRSVQLEREAEQQQREELLPWGAAAGQGAAKKAKGKPQAAAKAQEQLRLPRALLQQHCQKQGWPVPTFKRLASSAAGSYRYSVTVDTRRSKGGKKSKAGPSGPRTFQAPAGDDAWEDLQDAQHAASAWALFQFLPEQQLQHQLPEPWRRLWLSWVDGQQESGQEEARQQAQEREAFVKSLLQQQKQAEAGSTGQQGQQGQQQGQDQQQGQQSIPLMDGEEEVEDWELQGDAAEAQDEYGTQVEREAAAAAAAEGGAAASAAVLSAAEQRISRRLAEEQQQWHSSREGLEMLKVRQQLPITAIREQLVEAFRRQDVVVVSGDTGCGKTTQVPQYILDEAIAAGVGATCSIICTQPRRIAAISVAARVAAERGEPEPGTGGRGQQQHGVVGYHVRLDAAVTSHTRMLFCTTGILLRRLASDPQLSSTSCVVVDEVHERTCQGDFLMALLREMVARRRAAGRPLKVVLMSATLDASLYSQYFGGCPVLAAEGRTHPVRQLYLEEVYDMTGYRLAPDAPAALKHRGKKGAELYKRQTLPGNQAKQSLIKSGWGDDEADLGPLNPHYEAELYDDLADHVRRNLARLDEEAIDMDLLEEVVYYIDTTQEPGAVLVFLPGAADINNLHGRLSSAKHFRSGGHMLVTLHSSVSPADQRLAFKRPPPGVRKIVLATNIAETSLTIEDVVYVVDCGRHKERRYDPGRRMSSLVEDWASRAALKQRRGRAGRVRPGLCFGLYTRKRFEHQMRSYEVPEMARVPLEELVLQIHLMGLGTAESFLSQVLQPPEPKAVLAAVAVLREVGALAEEQEQLTALGTHLAALPVEPRLGKLLVLGACLGCLAPVLTIAACMSYKSPFAAPLDKQAEVERAKKALAAPGGKTLAAGQQSDHLLMAAVYGLWQKARQEGASAGHKAARQHCLSVQTLEQLAEMRTQFAAMLADIRFVRPPAGASTRAQQGREPSWLDDPKQPFNCYAQQPAVIKAVLCAALDPNVVVVTTESAPASKPDLRDPRSADISIHPSSVNAQLLTQQLRHSFLVFLEKVKTSRVYVRDCSAVSAMALLLFGGSIEVVHEEGVVMVDGWIKVKAAAQTAVLVKQIRAALVGLLQAMVREPDRALQAGGSGGQLVETIVGLLRDAEAAADRS